MGKRSNGAPVSLKHELAELFGERLPNNERADRAEQCEALCSWVAKGKSVRSYCARPNTPSMRTVYVWLEKDIVFADAFRRAKAVGYDALAQECLDIADAPLLDGDGADTELRQRQLRIGTRLKLLARWDTTRYGDKLQLGGDGGHPIQLSNEDAHRQVLELLATAKRRQLAAQRNLN